VKQDLFLSDPQVIAVEESIIATIRALSPRLVDPAWLLLDNISTSNWALEWNLPRWLGDSFGIEPDVTRTLVRCNVLGLGYIRIQDDLIDREVDPEAWTSTILLANLLYTEALLGYIRLFAADSPFWGHFQQLMSQWTRGTLHSSELAPEDFRVDEPETLLRLAERGAPLKICCAAACLCAGREEHIAALSRSMDHLLVSLVLLDHANDWTDDLDGGRFNAFVAFISPHPQTAAHLEDNRTAVLQNIYLGDAARPYFDLVQQHLRSAIEAAKTVACPDLSQYLLDYEARAAGLREQLVAKAQAGLRTVTEQLFGPDAQARTTP
jgi:hypothetical protein